MYGWICVFFAAGVVLGAVLSNVLHYHRAGTGVFSVTPSEEKSVYNLVLTTPTDKLAKCKKLIFKVVVSPDQAFKE